MPSPCRHIGTSQSTSPGYGTLGAGLTSGARECSSSGSGAGGAVALDVGQPRVRTTTPTIKTSQFYIVYPHVLLHVAQQLRTWIVACCVTVANIAGDGIYFAGDGIYFAGINAVSGNMRNYYAICNNPCAQLLCNMVNSFRCRLIALLLPSCLQR